MNHAFASSDLGFALQKRTHIASTAFTGSLAARHITAIWEHNHSLRMGVFQLLSPLQKPTSLTTLYQQTPVFETNNCTLTNKLSHSHFLVPKFTASPLNPTEGRCVSGLSAPDTGQHEQLHRLCSPFKALLPQELHMQDVKKQRFHMAKKFWQNSGWKSLSIWKH